MEIFEINSLSRNASRYETYLLKDVKLGYLK